MAAKKRTKTNPGQLADYRKKRDFDRTAEPSGGAVEASASGHLFVVQKHAARRLHYDLRLEMDGVLKSWAVPRGPSLDPTERPLAVQTEDHPIEYGSFEGVIPQGEYGGGTVMLWDEGRWEPIGDPVAGLERGDLKFRLTGTKLRGAWVLARMSGKAGEGGRNWLLIKKKDDEARSVRSFNVQSEMPLSVSSGRSMQEIADDPEAVWRDGGAQPMAGAGHRRRTKAAAAAGRGLPDPAHLSNARPGPLPETLRPQLATLVRAAPEGDQWLHEIKLDGYRLMCRIENGDARLLTRNGHDWTDRMPAVAAAAARLPLDSAILDGEVVVLDARGIADFQALQNAFRGSKGTGFTYFLFDVPFADGFDLRPVPLVERKGYLQQVLAAAPLAAPTLQYCDHIVGKGPVVFEQAAASGLEGIISKRASSPYESRRTESWIKIKCVLRQTFLIGGFTDPSGSRSGFGALLLGQHEPDGGLVYCGRVGTGFTDRTLEDLYAALDDRRRADPPFRNPEADPDFRTVHWVEPELIAEVEFISWTNEGVVRHASFQGLRADVDPADVVTEKTISPPAPSPPARAAGKVIRTPASPDDAFVGGVRISNPRRTVYPEAGVTKQAVAEYYLEVADWILPFVARRPLSLVRCPLGLAGESFYQRHVGEGFPEAIRGLTVEGEEEPCIVIDDAAGLVSLVQIGVLEIHPWGAREDNVERPDQLILDLDPGPGITWEHLVESGRFIRDYLEDLGLTSFAKTSGGKGLHVVVPLIRRSSWEQVKTFARAIAVQLSRLAPRNFVATMSKARREHRIYIDYLRNQRGSTSVAPYSTRARPGAFVSTPLRWSELSAKREPSAYTVATVPRRLVRLKEDPWDGYATTRQQITAAMRKKVE